MYYYNRACLGVYLRKGLDFQWSTSALERYETCDVADVVSSPGSAAYPARHLYVPDKCMQRHHR
jgi:hypothetical protein